MAQYLVFSALSHYFWTSNFFSGLSTTDETLVVEMRIWCIKIGNVFALHATLQSLREKVVSTRTPMDDHLTDANAVPVEMTEQTSSDEIAQWVGVNLNSEEEEEELPEFNSVEELSQWLGL
jgi:hypothetical protein